MDKKQPNAKRPAYPPQILLDQFQRPVAVAPGFSKLEAVALALLQVYIKMASEKTVLVDHEDNKVDPISAAFHTAAAFCERMDELENQPETLELT